MNVERILIIGEILSNRYGQIGRRLHILYRETDMEKTFYQL